MGGHPEGEKSQRWTTGRGRGECPGTAGVVFSTWQDHRALLLPSCVGHPARQGLPLSSPPRPVSESTCLRPAFSERLSSWLPESRENALFQGCGTISSTKGSAGLHLGPRPVPLCPRSPFLAKLDPCLGCSRPRRDLAARCLPGEPPAGLLFFSLAWPLEGTVCFLLVFSCSRPAPRPTGSAWRPNSAPLPSEWGLGSGRATALDKP